MNTEKLEVPGPSLVAMGDAFETSPQADYDIEEQARLVATPVVLAELRRVANECNVESGCHVVINRRIAELEAGS